ncbi:hypothetical protein CGCF415_v009683 [Colletotrichum fructicola]|nr:hypothetical protein CGCFRS4_v008101 [Colletotrichum fructicola]KAF4901674.1 hypothetical protein CGCF415_v009683 [Colletotrichum fructicola]KAF4934999.1 hypothetical protein CGCF245_v008063 [Colletotrichum fructicola]
MAYVTTPSQAEERLTSFADTWRFPEFEKLDSDQDVAGTPFYDEPGDRWCLLAEITDVSLCFASASLPATARLKIGHTIALLYPHQHDFLDGTQGVRVEDVITCRVFPVKLAGLFRINSDLCAYTGPLGTLKKCHSCGKEDPSVVKCGRCGLYYYCNKDCQTLEWNQKGHKEACRALKDPNLRALFKITVGEGEHRFQFPR